MRHFARSAVPTVQETIVYSLAGWQSSHQEVENSAARDGITNRSSSADSRNGVLDEDLWHGQIQKSDFLQCLGRAGTGCRSSLQKKPLRRRVRGCTASQRIASQDFTISLVDLKSYPDLKFFRMSLRNFKKSVAAEFKIRVLGAPGQGNCTNQEVLFNRRLHKVDSRSCEAFVGTDQVQVRLNHKHSSFRLEATRYHSSLE